MENQIDKTELQKQELVDYIKYGECKEYFFGIHGIDIDNFKEYVLNKNEENFNKYKHITTLDDIYKSILNEGLLVPYDITTSTVHNLGLGKNLKETALNYYFPCSCGIFNVLIAIPPYMTIGNKRCFVGDLSKVFDDRRKIFLYTILTVCILNKKIPNEYIFGSFEANNHNDKTILFHKNLSHISLMSEHEQKLFFEKLFRESGVKMDLLEMILKEKVSPTVDKTTSLVEHYDYITMYNTICNTINRKRIYENPNIPEDAIKKVLKR